MPLPPNQGRQSLQSQLRVMCERFEAFEKHLASAYSDNPAIREQAEAIDRGLKQLESALNGDR